MTYFATNRLCYLAFMVMIRILVGLLFYVASLGVVFAQSAPDDLENDVAQLVREVRAQVDTFQTNLDNEEALVSLAADLVTDQQEALEFGVVLTEMVANIRTRLDQLGPAPGEGEPAEPELLAAERTALQEERARINLLIGELEDATIFAGNLIDDIAERRRELFQETLSQRYDISEAFGPSLWEDVGERWANLERRIGSWWSFTWRTRPNVVLACIFSAVLLGAVAVFVSLKTFGGWIHRDSEHDAPTFFARLTIGFWYTLLPTLVFWFWLGAAYFIFDFLNIWRPDIAGLVQTLIAGLAILFLIIQLSRAVFAPYVPNWRLIKVPQRSAFLLHALMVVMAIIVVADAVITRFNIILGVSIPVTVALSLLTSIAVGTVLIAMGAVKVDIRPGEDKRTDWPAWLRIVLILSGVALIATALFGYLGLARFASQQIVITGAILSTMYLGYRAARAIGEANALAQTSFGEMLRARHAFSERGVDQAGLVASGLLVVAVFLIGVPIIALTWGFRWSEITDLGYRLVTNITLGSISISLIGLLTGLILFFVGLWGTRAFQRWLDGTVLERGGVETGARTSIRTAVGYAGIALAALLAISAAGFDLTQLAFIAGALSLGIGFGLQNIVSNFVSGLILLAERPFKAGDIIEAGGFTGVVDKVNVRATEIITFDKKTLILPNSELINGTVINWIHKTTLGRVQVPVGVYYDSDAKRVHDMLLEIANDHPRVLSNPEPFVAFDNFGDSSLDFVLYAYLADIGYGLAVRTELRMAILERFRAANIEIPFPQRDINIKAAASAPDLKDVANAEDFGVIETSKARRIEDD
ncbi:MAG: mechanosensitive ion channel domain-containing protein [Pseudomonadota bacterium]